MSPGDCSTHSFGNTKIHVARSWKYYFQERARQESVVGLEMIQKTAPRSAGLRAMGLFGNKDTIL